MSGRIMFAAPKSGSGKTTLASGLLYLLAERGIRSGMLKCGPDYIDTMYAAAVPGVQTGNLDSFFLREEEIREKVKKMQQETEFLLLEGAMGYYDGTCFTSRASCYELARVTETPVILVVDCKGMGASLLALIRGFLEQEKPSGIVGVICSRMSEKLYREAAPRIEALSVRSLGYVPDSRELSLSSRYLGLKTPEEPASLLPFLRRAAEIIEQTVDVDGILELAGQAADIPKEKAAVSACNPDGIRSRERAKIAVSRDEAFCFCYEDNLRAMRAYGIDPVFFSPIRDKRLPEGCQGLYLCGGYPELYAAELEQNKELREEVYRAVTGGMPTVAECGGFLYLQKELQTENGSFSMAGVLPGSSRKGEGLRNFGYHWMQAGADSLLFRKGERIPVHEFHYYVASDPGDAFWLKKEGREDKHPGGYASGTLYAGFPHLYFEAFPRLLLRWKEACHGKGV